MLENKLSKVVLKHRYAKMNQKIITVKRDRVTIRYGLKNAALLGRQVLQIVRGMLTTFCSAYRNHLIQLNVFLTSGELQKIERVGLS